MCSLEEPFRKGEWPSKKARIHRITGFPTSSFDIDGSPSMCFQSFCGFPHRCPHRCSLTGVHLLLDGPAPPAATLLSLLLSRQVLWALWGHNWLPHGGFGWSAGLREGTLPISGPEDQHPCSCPAPPCVAKGPSNYCPGGSLPIITHLSALLILSPLTLGNSRDPCLPPGGG